MATKVGDELWDVEWMTIEGHDSSGDFDPDSCVYSSRMFKRKSEAMRFARKVFTECKGGVVYITPMRFEPYDDADSLRFPHVGFWEAIGETEYYEGEE